MNYVNNFDLCQTKSLLGCEIIEKPDEVIDVILNIENDETEHPEEASIHLRALHIKDEKTWVYEV